MKREIDNNMKKIILGWRIPNVLELENRNIEFVFDSELILNIDDYYKNLYCKHNNVRFCLYDFDNENIIFSMDFFESSKINLALTGEKPHMRLELLNVNDYRFRKKGIASYYLKKLQEHCIESGLSFIKVKACANDKIFKNASEENSLTQEELEEFYKGKSTQEMPIKRFLLD
ncbi:hypothetical protein [Paraclostridium bifermentans]|uniref:hypothetical protein n=1 Tax=Paraclostridium bifermentans TaxID=1490 RepID=UPI0024BA0880|nr:hypothetical protein [Paraclostridium bifermentans]